MSKTSAEPTVYPPEPVEISISIIVSTPARAILAVVPFVVVTPKEIASTMFLFAGTVADEDVTDRRPKPKAETATSAMRLSVVFVDICFLSLVDPEDFPRSAW
jgi:hypothetical protein